MDNQIIELNEAELEQIEGGTLSWGQLGMVWTAGGIALGVVAGVAGAIAVSPIIVIGATVLGGIYALGGAEMMYADSTLPHS